jgi:hypothetical protein
LPIVYFATLPTMAYLVGMVDLGALSSLMDVLANAGTAGALFRRQTKGVEMVSLSEMSLERPPVYNPEFTPVRAPKVST